MNDQELIGSLPAAKSALEALSDTSLRVPCYCEENVWRLAYRKMHQQQHHPTQLCSSYHVAFVSNPKGCVPMFEQLAGDPDDREVPVMWDYHVILFMTTTTSASTCNQDDTTKTKTFVWDIDSFLPCPCPLEDYIEMVFPNHLTWRKEYLPYFRVVDASVYLRHFSSDRSHMYNSESKTWSAPPPLYDCILLGEENNDDRTCSSNNSDDDSNGNNNSTTGTSSATTTTTTLKQYMTISKKDVVDSQQNCEDRPFGQIYSLSQLLQRFRIKN